MACKSETVDTNGLLLDKQIRRLIFRIQHPVNKIAHEHQQKIDKKETIGKLQEPINGDQNERKPHISDKGLSFIFANHKLSRQMSFTRLVIQHNLSCPNSDNSDK